MLKHLAYVEDDWFSRRLHGREPHPPWVTEALAAGGLGRLARQAWPDGSAPSLRWILVHIIEEYARHNGHANLLRESVDGLTGE